MSEMHIPEIKVSFKGGKEEAHKISCSKDAYAVANRLFNADTLQYQEEFIVVYLNAQHKTIGYYKAALGGIEACIVDPRIILGIALKVPCTAMILFHNHPSGNLNVSRQDRSITQKLFTSANMLDINVLDHIIIGDGEYHSFADAGEMEF
ncbi:MAG: JAB domain-containing protein [Candidatus Marinimicrobia bacterium]|nr:JAB domain-containing protein [Candidatus Neomarinimicrobiota bacterium]